MHDLKSYEFEVVYLDERGRVEEGCIRQARFFTAELDQGVKLEIWRSTWYEHQNLRDERVEAFTSLLWEGEHEYTYFARATTPGLFIVPPAKAEEMYEPETFGRGKSDRVSVD